MQCMKTKIINKITHSENWTSTSLNWFLNLSKVFRQKIKIKFKILDYGYQYHFKYNAPRPLEIKYYPKLYWIIPVKINLTVNDIQISIAALLKNLLFSLKDQV